MSLGNYCKEYRIFNQRTLADLTNSDSNSKLVKSLSAFEHGRSTNYLHIKYYTELAEQVNDRENFALGLLEVLNNE